MKFYKNSINVGSVFLVVMLLTLQACSPNNVTIQNDYKKYFDETATTGSFGLFDNGSGEFFIYNLAQFKDSSYTPASTFEIINALVGVETGKIVDEKMVLSVDSAGPIRMDSAFKQTSTPYFMEVARRIGKDTMQHWLDSLQYGTKNMNAAVDSFWYNNKLMITPDEQMGLVKRLYFGQLPFQKRTQEMVKMLMLQTANTNYKLSYKIGYSNKQNGKGLAWIIGWIEENKHPYFFVLQTEGAANTDIKTSSMTVLNKILKSQGFFEGKR